MAKQKHWPANGSEPVDPTDILKRLVENIESHITSYEDTSGRTHSYCLFCGGEPPDHMPYCAWVDAKAFVESLP